MDAPWNIPWKRFDQWSILALEGILLSFPVALSGDVTPVWMLRTSLALALTIALWAWWRALTQARSITGTPIERIASAAQGYAALAGRGQLLEGRQRVFEPGAGIPCLWRRIVYSRRGPDGGPVETTTDESDASFLLDDGSGNMCAVDPEGAEIRVKRRYAGEQEDGAHLEYWSLRPGDQIYVLGQFSTVGSVDSERDTHRQVGELLELWKAERPELLRRFDQDGDGELNPQEWNLARAAARREVERNRQQAMAAPQAHIMRKPKTGQSYLITDSDPRTLARRLWLWALVHGAVFIGAAAVLALLHLRGGRTA